MAGSAVAGLLGLTQSDVRGAAARGERKRLDRKLNLDEAPNA
jgi:hypothetical protein